MWMNTILIKLELAMRLAFAAPTVDIVEAYRHASAAVDASDARVPAELLLGMAWVESRFDPTATSRIEGGKRRTGSYPSTAPPRGGVRGSLYCGPLQTYGRDWATCLAMRELAVGYAAGAAEMRTWLGNRAVAGDVFRALLGHGCGNAGLRTGRCSGYPNRVLRFARKLGAPPPRRAGV